MTGPGGGAAGLALYHAGFETIKSPDIRRGRKNADFGQGFYLSPDRDFSLRWARERAGRQTVINAYWLDTRDLNVLRMTRDAQWFDYIYANRAGYPDSLGQWDVIIGPIANDTIYDVWGITTSGLLDRETSLQLLMLGGAYQQVVVKTERAASRLAWRSAEILPGERLAAYRAIVSEEQAQFQQQFVETMNRLMG